MKPSDVGPIFRLALLDQLAMYGHGDVLVIEADQPTKQGRVDDGLYWRLSNPTRHGWQARRYSPEGRNAGHTEHQLLECMMTLTGLVHDDYATGYSSNDLANLAQMVVNSLPFVEALRRQGVGIQRVTPIRTIRFNDEADDYAIEASFDVNITIMRTIAPATPTVEQLNPDIVRI